MAVYLLPSLGSRLKKMSFSTLNRRNLIKVSRLLFERNGSRSSGLPTPLTRFRVEKVSFSTLNRWTPILINGAEAPIYETTVAMANCLIVSLVLRLKKCRFQP